MTKICGLSLVLVLVTVTIVSWLIKQRQVLSKSLGKGAVKLWIHSLVYCCLQRLIKDQESPGLTSFHHVEVWHSLKQIDTEQFYFHNFVFSNSFKSESEIWFFCSGISGPETFRQKLLWIVLNVVVAILNVCQMYLFLTIRNAQYGPIGPLMFFFL